MATKMPQRGDRISLTWSDGSKLTATIEKAKHVDSLKHGSNMIFTLVCSDGQVRKTRLLHLKWKLVSKTASKKRKRDATVTETNVLPAHTLILAPMVGGSELAFRLLCRRYGAHMAYTPMMNAERFANDPEYRSTEFQTHPEDHPLVAHFCGNEPQVLVKAAKQIESQCDAIDLNLGCPQRIAHAGHFGSYLLGKEDRSTVLSIVKALSTNISKPIFVKIRLLDSIDDTVELCEQLVEAGARLIAIHARYRVNLVGRSGPGARDGPALLDQVKEIKQRVTSVPIIANGNVREWNDVVENLRFTRADGIMSAEGLLDNPALFYNKSNHIRQLKKRLKGLRKDVSLTAEQKEEKAMIEAEYSKLTEMGEAKKAETQVSPLQLAQEYLELARQFPVKQKSVIFHIRRMCKQQLTQYQLMRELLETENVEQVQPLIDTMLRYETEGGFVFDPEKEKRLAAAEAQRKKNESNRKNFEARMVRKAKREGKPLDHYLKQGANAPNKSDLDRVRGLPESERMAMWKQHWGQHCFAFHFHDGGCKRDRTCAFLHSDPIDAANTEPSWLEERG